MNAFCMSDKPKRLGLRYHAYRPGRRMRSSFRSWPSTRAGRIPGKSRSWLLHHATVKWVAGPAKFPNAPDLSRGFMASTAVCATEHTPAHAATTLASSLPTYGGHHATPWRHTAAPRPPPCQCAGYLVAAGLAVDVCPVVTGRHS